MFVRFSLQARKTESSLQRIRQGAQRRAGASSDVSDHNVSDTDKICMQLFLDIQVTTIPWLFDYYIASFQFIHVNNLSSHWLKNNMLKNLSYIYIF